MSKFICPCCGEQITNLEFVTGFCDLCDIEIDPIEIDEETGEHKTPLPDENNPDQLKLFDPLKD